MDKLKRLKHCIVDAWDELDSITWGGIISQVPDDGVLLEFGVYVGTSLTDICKLTTRTVYGFDWFRGLPKPWEDVYTGADYQPGHNRLVDLGGEIVFEVPKNARLIVGLVEDTLPEFLARYSDAVAFAHFDMDIYEPTAFTLKHLTNRVQTGSVLVFDEIGKDMRNHNNEGKAFSEFLKYSGFDFEVLGVRHHESMAVRLI